MTLRRHCQSFLVQSAVLASMSTAATTRADNTATRAAKSSDAVDAATRVAARADAPEIASFALKSFVATGAGCPAGTLVPVVQAREGASSVALRFSSFAPEGRAPRGDRALTDDQACNLTVELSPKAGYQIGLVAVQARAFADVLGPRDTKVGLNNVARFERAYFFGTPKAANGLSFPVRTSYLAETLSVVVIDDEAPGTLRFADCNAPVVARSEIRLAVSGEYNFVSLKSGDHNAGLTFNLMTRACSGNEPGDPVIVKVREPSVAKNVCLLDGVGTRARTKVCYGANGEVLSTTPDPNP